MYKFRAEVPLPSDNVYTNYNNLSNSKLYYPSNIVGSNIKNAATGEVYTDLVGSHNESKYYRVLDTSGSVDNNGLKLGPHTYNYNANKLFYENAEQYFQHFNHRFGVNITSEEE